MADLQRLFEYVALTVMVRNGDGHLKSFSVPNDDPGWRQPNRCAGFTDPLAMGTEGARSDGKSSADG
jgi:hypothetical protein